MKGEEGWREHLRQQGSSTLFAKILPKPLPLGSPGTFVTNTCITAEFSPAGTPLSDALLRRFDPSHEAQRCPSLSLLSPPYLSQESMIPPHHSCLENLQWLLDATLLLIWTPTELRVTPPATCELVSFKVYNYNHKCFLSG